MCLNINIKNLGEENNEYRAAQILSDNIRTSIPKGTEGNIDILVGVNIPFGKVSDIDILIIANLENCTLDIDNQSVEIKSFCTTIELKEQTLENVLATTTDVFVSYPTTGTRKNASAQNRDQKYTLLNFCKRSKYNIFISNILWLKSISIDDWSANDWNAVSPILFSSFEFSDIVKQIIKSGHRIYNNTLNAIGDSQDLLNQLVQDLSYLRTIPIPNELRRKTELLVANQLERTTNQIIDTNGFSCIDGKAGTGKTFLLLKTALKQAEDGYCCALLTYNNALTLDLQRLLSFVKTSPDAKNNLVVCTLHSYINSLSRKIGWNKAFDADKILNYITSLQVQNNHQPLKYNDKYDLDDFVFIDEAQDCTPSEKEILEQVFGKDRIIVAKSALQKIRRQQMARWGTPNIKLNQGLRQKNNIVNFLKTVAQEMGISDTCVGYSSIIDGGNIIITSHYTTNIHTRLEENCHRSGCSNYDILVLIPPSLVHNHKFINAERWKREGKISLIDGSDTKSLESCRQEELINSCRIYQYESCRGLEGWATVCYNLDEIVNIKCNEWTSNQVQTIDDPKRLRLEFAYQWIMMPLTRAIDTLVITIKDPNSQIAEILRKAAASHPDFVESYI